MHNVIEFTQNIVIFTNHVRIWLVIFTLQVGVCGIKAKCGPGDIYNRSYFPRGRLEYFVRFYVCLWLSVQPMT